MNRIASNKCQTMCWPFMSHRKTDPELNYLVEKAETGILKGKHTLQSMDLILILN